MNNGHSDESSEILARLKRLEEMMCFLIEKSCQIQSSGEAVMSCQPSLLSQVQEPPEKASGDVKKMVEDFYLKYLLEAQERFGTGFWQPPNQSGSS